MLDSDHPSVLYNIKLSGHILREYLPSLERNGLLLKVTLPTHGEIWRELYWGIEAHCTALGIEVTPHHLANASAMEPLSFDHLPWDLLGAGRSDNGGRFSLKNQNFSAPYQYTLIGLRRAAKKIQNPSHATEIMIHLGAYLITSPTFVPDGSFSPPLWRHKAPYLRHNAPSRSIS